MVLRDMVRGEDRVLESGRKGQSIEGVSVSPDGTKIAYIVQDRPTGRSTLYLRPLAGGEARELSHAEAPNGFANVAEWTPDSTRLIVAKGGLWIVPIDGGAEVEIPGLHPKIAANTIRVHPDGKRVAFSTGDARSEVWTLTNFLTASGASK